MAEALGKEDIKEQKWQMTLPIDTVDLGENARLVVMRKMRCFGLKNPNICFADTGVGHVNNSRLKKF